MLTAMKIDKYCEVLLWGLGRARKQKYREDDIVLVRYDLPAIKMAEALQAKLLEKGLNPILRLGMTPVMEQNFFKKSNLRQLVFKTPGDEYLYHSLNGAIYIHAPQSLTHLMDVDPKRISRAAVARKYLRNILDASEAKGKFGWTLCLYPTEELAKHAKLSPQQYTAQVIRACYLDKKDPVGKWNDIHKKAQSIKNWLNNTDIRTLHIESEHTDLKITPGKRRRWVGISGHNIPSFELFLSPDWRGTEGIYYADQPSYRAGNYVEGVEITFKKGSATKVRARKGQTFTSRYLSTDRGATRVGEFSLTDKRFSRITTFMANTLYDENYGGKYGNCHLALGASYADTYDGNPSSLSKATKKKLGFNDSAIHWDLVNTEKKTVTALLGSGEKKIIYENGKFTIKGIN